MSYKLMLVFCILLIQSLFAHSRRPCRERSLLERDDPDYVHFPIRLTLQCSLTHANLTIHSTAEGATEDSLAFLQADLICTGISNSSTVYADSETLTINPNRGEFRYSFNKPEGHQCTVESCIEDNGGFRHHHLQVDTGRECDGSYFTSSSTTIQSSQILSQNSIIQNTPLPTSSINVNDPSSTSSYGGFIVTTSSSSSMIQAKETSIASLPTPTQQLEDDFKTNDSNFILGIDSNLLISIMTIAVVFFIVISVCLVMGTVICKTLMSRKRRKQLEDGDIVMEHKIDLVTLSASPSLVTIYHDQLEWQQPAALYTTLLTMDPINVGGKETIKTNLSNFHS